jgi:hypothetical protein
MSSEPEDDLVTRLLCEFRQGTTEERRSVLHILADLGPKAAAAVPPLIAALRDPDPAVRPDAARALACIGKAAVGPLVEALHDDDVDFRQAVFIALGLIGPAASAALPVVRAALDDEQLGPAATQALRQIEHSQWAERFHDLKALLPAGGLLLGTVAILLLGAAALTWAARELFPDSGAAGPTAAVAVAFLGVVMGALIGGHYRGVPGAMVGSLVLGIGGGLTGLLLGGAFGAVLEPLNRVLGRG